MLLLFDIGNTNIKIGFYDNGIRDVLRLDTVHENRDTDGYASLIKDYILQHRMERPEGAVISSVVPRLTPLLTGAVNKGFGFNPVNVSYDIKTGLKFCVKNPEGLGADRIANAVAARKLYKGHLVVIDFGSATTFCVISSKGEYMGGSIMPGLGISADILAGNTAKLPKMELKAPEKVLGDDTESSIISGLILGHAGAAERIVREIWAEALSVRGMRPLGNSTADKKVIATGGFADLVVPYMKGVKEINPLLTLEGLKIIYELNV